MKMYRIKKEAVPFILPRYADKVFSLQKWESLGIYENALDELKPVYLTYGIKINDNSSDLGGWNETDGGEFCFTIHFPSMKFMEHDQFTKGHMIRKLMDIIQYDIDNYFINFNQEIEQ